MDRRKRRTLAQRIGSKGEKLFSVWAEDHHLSPTKTGEDLGTDFFCQVLRPISSARSEEVTGAILAAHVRSTEGKSRPRILLDRIDAADVLQHTHPACLVGVHTTTNQIGVLLVEEKVIDRLQQFLGSMRKTLSIRLDEMELDSTTFDSKLAAYIRPGVQSRIALYKAQRAIQGIAPGASVSLNQTSDGGDGFVVLPWLSSAMTIDPAMREEVRVLAFERGVSPDQWPGVSLQPQFHPLLELVDGPTHIAGAVEETEELAIESSGGTATATFRIRRVSDELAYVHDIGLALVGSDRRRQGKDWVHETQSRLFKGPVSLGDAASDLPFFRLFQPGARILRNGTPVPIETWGAPLAGLGAAVEAIEKVAGVIGLNLGELYLDHLRNEEFKHSLGFLEALFIKKVPAERLIPAFIIDSGEDRDADDIPTETVTVELPVVLNVATTGLVVWIRAHAAMFLDRERRWSGLRVKEQLACKFEFHPHFEKSPHPELWVNGGWPVVPITGDVRSGNHSGRIQDPDKFFVEARILASDQTGSEGDAQQWQARFSC